MARALFARLGQIIGPESVPGCFILCIWNPVSKHAMVGARISSKDGLNGVNVGPSSGGTGGSLSSVLQKDRKEDKHQLSAAARLIGT